MIEPPDQDDEVAFILSLSTTQVKSTAVSLGHGAACSACKASKWILASYEDKPTILNIPMVNNPDLAAWFFNMQCTQCGLSKLISVSVIVDKLRSMEPQDGQ